MGKYDQHRWTPEEKSRVLEMLAAGASQRQVADELSVSLDALESRLRYWRRADRRKALTGPQGRQEAVAPPNVAPGQQLNGQSTLVTLPDGTQRWDKTRAEQEDAEPPPPGFTLIKVAQHTNPTGLIDEWRSYEPKAAARYAAAEEAIKSFVAEHVYPGAPQYLIGEPGATTDDTKTYYPIGDAHIGMLAWGEEVGESFDLKIAESELVECHRQLVARSPASRVAEICDLGDWWHAQNTGGTTPASGHKLDVDGRYGKVVRVGIRCGVALVEAALSKHERVVFRTLRGNHDPEQSLWLAEVLRAWFRNEPRVEILPAHKFYQFDVFGKNLVLWCHGNGTKPERLPQVLLARGAQWISQTRYRFAWTGHVHSKNAIEFGGMRWESFNTLAGKDAWHSEHAYDASQHLCSITLHREWGEDSRQVVGVERVRAALEAAGMRAA